MPDTTKGLKLLLRKEPLTDEEWLELIEARLQLIRPHLNYFTLETLGDFYCLRGRKGVLLSDCCPNTPICHGISLDSPCLSGDVEKISLKTQGIFFYHDHDGESVIYRKYVDSKTDLPKELQIRHVWGVTRDGEWVFVDIQYRSEPFQYDTSRSILYERAEKIVIAYPAGPQYVSKILGYNYYFIVGMLSCAVRNWEEHRRTLLNVAKELAETIQTEDRILNLLGR